MGARVDGDGGLRLTVLGEFTAARGDEPIDLGGRRQRAVLAMLVLARGEAVPAGRLIDGIWGERATENASGALQSYVSHLRRRLEPTAGARDRSGVILRAATGYAVRLPPETVDAWRFESLLQQATDRGDGAVDPVTPANAVRAVDLLNTALALWRGPAYADYAGEWWVEAEAARLTGLRAHARERLLESRMQAGESARLVPELEAMVAEEPLREERWRLLALALYRAQRQADALAALRRARGTLADELGVDPGPGLRALEAEMLAQSPDLDAPAARTPAPLVPPPLDRAPLDRDPDQVPPARPAYDLVDRERELAALRAGVEALVRGEAGLLVVEGPAGIGKTRLLTEAGRLAEQRGIPVLAARGSQLERSFGFGAARQLFEGRVLADAEGTLLDGAAASARGVFADLQGQPEPDGSFAVLHGLYWLTANLSRRSPLVLTIDDLQWCDSASLRFFAYLVKRLEGLPVLVVATLRTGEAHPDDALLAELAFDPAALALRPGPLSPEAADLLVRERLGEPAPPFAAACHRTTSGNPLLLRQLLRALESAGVRPDASHVDMVRAVGSRAVSSLVLMRLRRMSPEASRVARAVAVLGGGALLPAVAALCELPEDEAAAVLASLIRSEVLRDEQPLGFVHPLVRDAIYDDIPAGERALAHERAAAVLRREGRDPEQVAAHLLLAPFRGDPEAVRTLRAAARTAARRGAADSAVTLLRRALDEPVTDTDRVDLLLELGTAETDLDGGAAVGHLSEAHALLPAGARRSEVAVVLARTHVFHSPPGVATRFARAAALETPPELVDTRQALTALKRAGGIMHGLDPADYDADVGDADVGASDVGASDVGASGVGDGPETSGHGPGARMLAGILAWEQVLAGRDRERVMELARFALEDDQLWAVDNGLFWVIAANARAVADDDLGDFWDRSHAAAHTSGSLFAALSTNLWRGYTEWRRGELAEATQSAADSDEQSRMWGSHLGRSYAQCFLLHQHLDRGDLAAARQLADGLLPEWFMGEGGRLLREATARLYVEEGRPQEALTALDATPDPVGIDNPAWAAWRGLRARALAALGRREEALALAEEEVALLRRWGAPTYLGAALRLLGELAGPAGIGHLREAEALLSSTTAALELARARLSLASAPGVLASAPAVPDAEAVPLLEEALYAATACGAAGVCRAAAAELARRGAVVPDPGDDLAGRQRLTRTERRVLDLTQAGLSTHAVAQQLFLTPGTVSSTLETASGRSGHRLK